MYQVVVHANHVRPRLPRGQGVDLELVEARRRRPDEEAVGWTEAAHEGEVTHVLLTFVRQQLGRDSCLGGRANDDLHLHTEMSQVPHTNTHF